MAARQDLRFGRSEDEWHRLTHAGHSFLIDRARLARPTSYTEFNTVLAQRTGLRPFDFDLDAERAAMGYLLGRIVELDRPSSGLMISALVNYLNENSPGDGFFNLAKEQGLLSRGASEEEKFDFWVGQVSALERRYGKST